MSFLKSKSPKWVYFKKILLIGAPNSGKTTLCSYLTSLSSEQTHAIQSVSKTETTSFYSFDANIPKNDEDEDCQNIDEKMYINITVVNYDYYNNHKDKASFDYSFFFQIDLIIFLIDLTNESSLQYVHEFINQKQDILQMHKLMLLCTKADLENEIKINQSDIEQFQNEFEKEIITMNISLTNKNNIYPLIALIGDTLYKSYEFELTNHLKFQFPISNTLNEDPKTQLSSIKIFLFGNSGVGKKTFMNSFFNMKSNTATETDLLRTYMKIGPKQFRLEIWNMINLDEQMFRKASAFLIMFDLTDKKSFDMCEEIYNKISLDKSSECKVWLVGNKVDMNERVVNMEMIEEIKNEKNIAYVEVSALNGVNVYDLILSVTLDASQHNKMGQSSIMIEPQRDFLKNRKNCC